MILASPSLGIWVESTLFGTAAPTLPPPVTQKAWQWFNTTLATVTHIWVPSLSTWVALKQAVAVTTVTATGTITSLNVERQIVSVNAGATAITLTMPSIASHLVGGVPRGSICFVRANGSTGGITINAGAGATIQSAADNLSTYGATTSLNTTNSNSSEFIPISATQWACLANS